MIFFFLEQNIDQIDESKDRNHLSFYNITGELKCLWLFGFHLWSFADAGCIVNAMHYLPVLKSKLLYCCVATVNFVLHRKYLAIIGVSPFCSLFFRSSKITQPCPQVLSVDGSITWSGLHFWRHRFNNIIIIRDLT